MDYRCRYCSVDFSGAAVHLQVAYPETETLPQRDACRKTTPALREEIKRALVAAGTPKVGRRDARKTRTGCFACICHCDSEHESVLLIPPPRVPPGPRSSPPSTTHGSKQSSKRFSSANGAKTDQTQTPFSVWSTPAAFAVFTSSRKKYDLQQGFACWARRCPRGQLQGPAPAAPVVKKSGAPSQLSSPHSPS
jgi:hypothetical protein